VSKTYRVLLAAVVAVVAVGGYWKVVLAPKRAQAADLAQKVDTKKAQLAQTQNLIATYRNAKDAYRSNYATVVRLGKAVPADDDTRSLVVQLDAAAKRSGVEFANLDVATGSAPAATATTSATSSNVPPGAVNTGSYSVMPFTLSFAGDFGSLSSFFARLERFVTVQNDKIAVNGRLLRVESIDLQPGENGWPGISAQIGAASYIVPATPDPTSATPGTTTTDSTTTSTSSSTTTAAAG
jgi:Tfp pilus assembly protein PilO